MRKANTARSKKAKGKALESWLASELRKSGADPTAQPMPLSGALTFFKSDIRTRLPYSFECKNQENTKVWEWYEQASRDATGLEKPIVVFKRNYSEPMALLSASDLVQMITEIQQYVVFKRNYSEPMALLSASDLVQMITEIQQYYDILKQKESDK